MITCIIHDEADVDGFPLGGSGAEFNFDTLPRLGDILWLRLHANSFEEETKEINCVVTYSAQLCESNSYFKKSKNIGYLTVKIDESMQNLIKDKSLHAIANETLAN
jgi:hypothetical protein